MAKDKAKINKGIQTPEIEDGWVSVLALQQDDVPVESFLCNFDLHDPENADLVFLADQPASKKADDLVGSVIHVKWWICTKKEIPDRQQGGTCHVVRTALISPTREVVSSLSVGILKSVELMRRTVGTESIEPAIPMRVVGTKVGTGSDMLTLVPVMLDKSK